jgi:predicted alpha-1,2-mannosidase
MTFLVDGGNGAVGIRCIRVVAVYGSVALVLWSAVDAQTPQQDLASFVKPFVGTANSGNTFPGATLPFGMVAFSPEEESDKDPMRAPAPGGYQWQATGIRGFSLTHLSGAGCPAGGDVPLMPVTEDIAGSPSAAGSSYSTTFAHETEHSSPGLYAVKLDNGVEVELSATRRTGIAQFSFPVGHPEHILFRVSDSENGSSNARIKIDPSNRIVSGSVTSGGFCGPRSGYYTLHFVAVIDQPFHTGGTWTDNDVHRGSAEAAGGTFSANFDSPPTTGAPQQAKGSGGWLDFDPRQSRVVTVRIGISYVSEAGARANLEAEQPNKASLDTIRMAARRDWNRSLGRIEITGGTPDERTVFYTALYHALIAPNITNDVNGHYRGFDGKSHALSVGQQAQYADFSLWDVYRSQLQLVTWLYPQIGSDIAQSMLRQAEQNRGVWDRWTHLTGATGVMNGDPSAPAVADIAAFGGEHFDLASAYASLLKAATVPTAEDDRLSPQGQRPGLAEELKLHYIPAGASEGSAADTLEMATADFALSELALRAGDVANARAFRERSGWWRNLFNANATKDEGYIQPRNADGTWPAFDPSLWGAGFVEGTGAQYLWMVPFDPKGLFDAMGGNAAALRRLDHFFHYADGSWAWSNLAPNSAGLHANLSNEPTIEAPWLYDFAGQPWKTQETVRAAVVQLWSATPGGLPGNDDLGEMSSWYVWAAMGLYPMYPGRAELVLGSPSFSKIIVHRPSGTVTIRAPNAAADAPYITGLKVDEHQTSHPWLPASFAEKGGTLDFDLAKTPDQRWGSAPEDAPPSFGPSP